ncbi:hypothetical protein AMTR_s00110p00055190 [Amborella trichopoda]|uniref:Uncharacterized protein n=1 Tax=Amborella trichopoda TaxID=13333 RepID=W1NS81_AMBTC|nr:hypothetical protein AMTR_s00110p00055190 [Amborella trichopoda]
MLLTKEEAAKVGMRGEEELEEEETPARVSDVCSPVVGIGEGTAKDGGDRPSRRGWNKQLRRGGGRGGRVQGEPLGLEVLRRRGIAAQRERERERREGGGVCRGGVTREEKVRERRRLGEGGTIEEGEWGRGVTIEEAGGGGGFRIGVSPWGGKKPRGNGLEG